VGGGWPKTQDARPTVLGANRCIKFEIILHEQRGQFRFIAEEKSKYLANKIRFVATLCLTSDLIIEFLIAFA
jgi:hypothetical protein